MCEMFLKCISAPYYVPHTHLTPPTPPPRKHSLTGKNKHPLKKDGSTEGITLASYSTVLNEVQETEPDQTWPKDAHNTCLTSKSFQLILIKLSPLLVTAMIKIFPIYI